MAEDIRKQPFDIAGYRVVRWLGRGGMADVYLAIQLSLGRPVAIKVLAAERTPSEHDVTRFEQEARIIARLDHPHIVGIFDVGRTSNGQLYYTMPHMPNGHLAGRDLAQDENGVIAVVRALCQALAYAHEQGIVHRDVKPENVLFDKLDRPLLGFRHRDLKHRRHAPDPRRRDIGLGRLHEPRTGEGTSARRAL